MENKDELVKSVDTVVNKTFDAEIEEKRTAIYKEFQTSRKVGNFLTVLILIISIGSMILISGAYPWMPILGWSLLGAGVIGMIAFYLLSKKKFESHTMEYIAFVYNTLNKQTFSDDVYSDIEETPNKVEIKDFDGNGVYTNIVKVASRNIINGKYYGNSFKFAEAAIYKKLEGKKQGMTCAFVGKYFEIENTIKLDGSIVINIGREKLIDEPNAVANRTTLYSQDGITIYGDEGVDFRSIVGNEFVGKLKKISVEKHLMNCAISVFGGRTIVFMSYDDDVIAMPFDKPLKPEAFNMFVDDLKNIFGVVSCLGK